MVSTIEMNYHLKNVNKYIGKEVTIIVKGYVTDIDLINDFNDQIYIGGERKPILLCKKTKLSIYTTEMDIVECE